MGDAFLSRNTSRWRTALFVAVGLIYFVECLDLVNIRIDDVFITLRYSRNVIEGFGPVFNSGEKVEGYSSPTFMLLMAGIGALTRSVGHFEFYYLARALCSILGLLTLFVLYRIAKIRGNDSWTTALLILAAAASPFANIYNFAGMETPLVTLLLTLTILFYLLWSDRLRLRYALGFAVTLGLLTISRPEGIIYPVAILTGLFLARNRTAHEAPLPYFYRTVAAVGGIFLAFLAFRVSYYGELLPNTLYAKNDPGAFAIFAGVRYAAFFAAFAVLPYIPFILLKKPPIIQRIYAPVYFVIAAQFAFVIYAGGDWMPGFRLLLPIVPLILFLIFDRLELSRFSRERFIAAVTILMLIAGLSSLAQREQIRTYQKYRSGLRPSAFQPYEMDFYEIGRKLSEVASPGDRVLVAQIGLIPYLNDDLSFGDLFGLVDKHIAKDIRGRHGTRTDNNYFFSREFDYVAYVIAKSQPDLRWQQGDSYRSGMFPMDTFLNDPRFSDEYEPLYKGTRGAIFKRISR